MVGGKKISFAALGPCRNEYEAWARGVGFRSSWLLSAKPAACFLLLLGLVATKLKPSRAPGPLAAGRGDAHDRHPCFLLLRGFKFASAPPSDLDRRRLREE